MFPLVKLKKKPLSNRRVPWDFLSSNWISLVLSLKLLNSAITRYFLTSDETVSL